MSLNTGMGYDTERRSTRATGIRITWRIGIAAAVGVLLIGIIVAQIVGAVGTPAASPAVPPAPGTQPGQPGGPAPVAEPTVAPPMPGAEAETEAEAKEATGEAQRPGASAQVWATFEAFMAGWVSTDPGVRQRVLAETATEQLAAGLVETRPENVITAPRTKVEVARAGEYSAEFQVWFASVPTSIHVVVIADPGSSQGWRVTAIEKRGD